MPWLHVKYNNFEIILKLFQCFISHVVGNEIQNSVFSDSAHCRGLGVCKIAGPTKTRRVTLHFSKPSLAQCKVIHAYIS